MTGEQANAADPGSFRDPSNRVMFHDGQVFRALDDNAAAELDAVMKMAFMRSAMKAGRVIDAERTDVPEGLELPAPLTQVISHPRIDAWSYPYEWTFSMLQDAAILQLELLAEALEADATCKDATPFNIQFQGAKPIFIDFGSFERYTPGDPWYGYLQFCQLFLYPLLLQAYAGIPFQPLLIADIDGISPDLANKMLNPSALWRKGVPVHVALHARAQRQFADSDADVKKDLKKGGFSKALIQANVKGLRKLVGGLQWSQSDSEWSSYENRPHYTTSDLDAKEQFVREVAGRRHRSVGWDVGCNDGRFSRAIAEHCDQVLAFDSDHLVVDLLYRSLRSESTTNILPLVLDLSKPSPGLGWRAAERRPFLERNSPDLVLFLAVIHHLAVTSNIPLTDILTFLHDLDTSVVMEFPTEDDPMVRRILKNKKVGVHDQYNLAFFEDAVASMFDVRQRITLSEGTRVLYELEPK